MSKKPIFEDIRKTIKVKLPSFPTSKIVLWEDLLGYQSKEVSLIKDDFDAGLLTLKFLIKEWNFVDKEDKSMPINEKNLGQLPQKDLAFLFTEIFSIIRERKKKIKVNSKK